MIGKRFFYYKLGFKGFESVIITYGRNNGSIGMSANGENFLFVSINGVDKVSRFDVETVNVAHSRSDIKVLAKRRNSERSESLVFLGNNFVSLQDVSLQIDQKDARRTSANKKIFRFTKRFDFEHWIFNGVVIGLIWEHRSKRLDSFS